MPRPRSSPHSKRKAVSRYISRAQALRKLQLSLKDFRRLCILKGIFPREPKKKSKLGNHTYYYTKDIIFLLHEPIVDKFREFKTFLKKFTRAMGRGEKSKQKTLRESRPTYRLDHVVKERYPTFDNAIADLDDALCMVHLFATLPQTRKIPGHRTMNCRKLVNEFQTLVLNTQALSKVFVSVKGYFFQAVVRGKPVTWLIPHKFTQSIPFNVDFQIMLTFLEFYEVLVQFVNLRLYKDAGLFYPPKLSRKLLLEGLDLSATLLQSQKKPEPSSDSARNNSGMTKQEAEHLLESVQASIDDIAERDLVHATQDDDAAQDQPQDADQDDNADFGGAGAKSSSSQKVTEKNVFKDCVFLLCSEVPREMLEFVIRSGSGRVTWIGESAPIPENHESITHEIVDRPSQKHHFLNREYCQPQWVFDCFNARCLLPTAEYTPGIPPPAHLSPFVDNIAEGYVPQRAREIDRYVAAADGLVLDDLDDDVPAMGPYSRKLGLYKPSASHTDVQMKDQDQVDAQDNGDDKDGDNDDQDGDAPEEVAHSDDNDDDDDDQDNSDDDDDDEEKHDDHDKIALAAILEVKRAQAKASMTSDEKRYQRELEAEAKGVQFSAHQKQEAKFANTEKNQQHLQKARDRKERLGLEVGMMPKKDRKLYTKTVQQEKRKRKRIRKLEVRAQPSPKRQKQE